MNSQLKFSREGSAPSAVIPYNIVSYLCMLISQVFFLVLDSGLLTVMAAGLNNNDGPWKDGCHVTLGVSDDRLWRSNTRIRNNAEF